MTAKTCLSAEQLSQFLQGALSADEGVTVTEHLRDCETCVQTLRTLESKDSFFKALQETPAPGGGTDEFTGIEDLKNRVKALAAPGADPTQLSEGKSRDDHGATQAASAPDDEELCSFLAPAEQPGELGRLGSYRVLQVLGKGGMGVVFKAEDTGLQRLVALKAMLPSMGTSATAKRRFLREARTAAALKHDHIVTIHQVGEDRGAPFLAMEFLEGESLETRLTRERKLPVAEVIYIGRQVAEGLAAAHDKDLIHRDIKPGNIWLESKTEPQRHRDTEKTGGAKVGSSLPLCASVVRAKILDFGLARAISDTTITQSRAIVGTPAFMAPEQGRGVDVDARADLFSLGSVLYRMATGKFAFSGPNPMSILRALELETPRPPQAIDFNIPPELSDLIMKLLEKKPEDRPGSAHEVADALRALETVAPVTQAASLARPRPPKRRLFPWAIAAGMLMAAAITAVIVIRLHTPDGMLIIESDDPSAEIEIKGEKVTIVKDKKRYELKVKPGKITVELKNGKEKLKLDTTEFEITSGEEKKIRVRLQTVQGKQADEKAQPLSPFALVTNPSPIKGVQSWTLETVAPTTESMALAFSRDGKRLATADLHSVRIWDVSSGNLKLQRILLVNYKIGSLNWGNEGNLWIQEHEGPNSLDFNIWNGFTGEKLRRYKYDYFFDPSTGDPLEEIREFELGQTQRPFSTINAMSGIFFSERFLATNKKGKLYFWDPKKLVHIRDFVLPKDVWPFAMADDGKTFVSVGDSVLIADTSDGKILREKKINTKEFPFKPNYCVLSSTNQLAITGDKGLIIVDWKLEKMQRIIVGNNESTTGQIRWSPDGKLLAVGTTKDIFLFEAGERTAFRVMRGRIPPNLKEPNVLSLSDGRSLTISPNGHFRDSPPNSVRLDSVRPELVYVIQTAKGQETLTPAEFEKRFGWKNDPEQVRPAPKQIDNPKPSPTSGKDREVAEWIINQGGGGSLFVPGARSAAGFSKGEPLPKGPFQITAVLFRSSGAEEVDLAKFAGLAKLEKLTLSGSRTTNAGLVDLKDVPALTYLNLTKTQVNDRGLHYLKSLSSLEHLLLGNNDRDSNVTGKGLGDLKHLPKLRHLSLDHVPLGDEGPGHVAALSNLETLGLFGCTVDAAGLKIIAKLPKLKGLSLGDTPLSGGPIAGVAHFKTLLELTVRRGQLRDDDLVHLKGLTKLKTLHLQANPGITDAGLKHLEGMKSLRYVRLVDTGVTAKGIDALEKALPACNVTNKN